MPLDPAAVCPVIGALMRPAGAHTSPFAVAISGAPRWSPWPVWELVSRVEKGVSANRHATVKI